MSRAEERKRRAEIRRKLAEARKVLKQLAKHKREALKQISRECRAARVAVRARVKAWRKHQAELLKAADYGARAQLRAECERKQRDAITNARTKAEGVRHVLKLEAEHLAEVRRMEKPRNPRRAAGGIRAAEKRAEFEGEIAANLDGEARQVWDKFKHLPEFQNALKKAARPGARLSATEAVLEHLQENPDLINDLRRGVMDVDAEWIARHKELERLSKLKVLPPDDDLPF